MKKRLPGGAYGGKKMKLFKGLLALLMATTIIGCGTVTTEVVEVPTEVVEVPSVEEVPLRELDLTVKVSQDITVVAADAIGMQKHRPPTIGKINSATKRPVRLKIKGRDTFTADSSSTTIGAPKHGFKVGANMLKRIANTDRETDLKVKATFDHKYSGGSTVIGATKPGLKVD